MIVIQVIVCLLAVYAVFCVMPAVVMFCTVFCVRTPSGREKKNDYYIPHAEKLAKAKKAILSLNTHEVSIKASDGITLRADYIDGGYSKTAVLFHGYHASPISNCAYVADMLYKNGYNLLMVYQRAHGKSDGRSTTLGYLEKEDALSWISYACENKGVDKVVVYGVSMGASAVAFASDRLKDEKICAMVLDCGFSSVYDQLCSEAGKLHVPIWSVIPILGVFYRLIFRGDMRDSAEMHLADTKIPALFLHGLCDESVDISQGKKNYAACGSEKQFLYVPGAAHTCAILDGGREAEELLLSFLDSHTTKK